MFFVYCIYHKSFLSIFKTRVIEQVCVFHFYSTTFRALSSIRFFDQRLHYSIAVH